MCLWILQYFNSTIKSYEYKSKVILLHSITFFQITFLLKYNKFRKVHTLLSVLLFELLQSEHTQVTVPKKENSTPEAMSWDTTLLSFSLKEKSRIAGMHMQSKIADSYSKSNMSVPTTNVYEFHLLHICQHTELSRLLNCCHSGECVKVSHCGFNL